MARSPETSGPLVLVCGDDEYSVRQRARQIWDEWCGAGGGMDQELVEAGAGTVDEAFTRLARLREALQTLPFFGGAKVIWFRDCTFLGEDRTSQSTAVTEALTEFAGELKAFRWDGVRLLISAGKPDRRRTFFKTLEKIGTVESFASLADEKDWADRVETEALRQLRAAGKEIGDEALAVLVGRVGPNLRTLANEVEKLTLYAGDRTAINLNDVELLTPVQKMAAGFALGEAVGDRNLPKALRVLDEELWTIRVGLDKKKSEIGLVYGLISKMRTLLLMKELRRLGIVRPAGDIHSFRNQISGIDQGKLPTDKKYNPLAGHPFPAFQALRQSERWETAELVQAMDTLLEANLKLVTSGLDEAVVLQRALVEMVGTGRAPSPSSSAPRRF